MDRYALAPLEEDAETARLGTRFLAFPQPPFIPGYERPEIVWVSTPLGEIAPGPADRRMYVVDPLLPKAPYDFPYLPPFKGAVHPPAIPGPDGHFDHIPVDSREFLSAHVFACVRRVLDICQSYLGREVPWFFQLGYDRLEIVPHLEWDNAHSGYGFLEMGEDDARGDLYPFALNFDAVAHEVAHLVLLGTLGLPRTQSPTQDFLAYHEAVADFVSLLGLLHFDTALDRILRRTRGNLLLNNELDRFAELSDEKQVRVLSHSLHLRDVGEEIHDRSKPFAGALFDTLVEIFQLILVERNLSSLDPREVEEARLELSGDELERELSVSRRDYELRHFAVKSSLIEARDLVGEMLTRSWSMLEADGLSFRDAAHAVIMAAESSRGSRFADRVYGNFAWRGIFPPS